MNEILDSEIESISNDTHSRKACWFFVANLVWVLIILVVTFFTESLSASSIDIFYKVSMIMILVFVALGLLGFRYAMLSIIKKEKWTYIKTVGVVGNFLFFVIIILLVAANVNDILM